VAAGAPPQGARQLIVRLPSSDGVDLALHDLGGRGRPLLISHATGFHGRCYAPLAGALADDFHSRAVDYRGHGASTRPSGWAGGALDWRGCGDDAVVTAGTIAPGGDLVAFGHSMGGAALLMAAARRPGLFARLVLFEPIVYPPPDPLPDPEEFPLVVGARRRRPRFDSYTAAYENFASKPPLSWFDPAALRAYVDHGFRPVDPDLADGEVELRCSPAFEAATFAGSMTNGVWDLLPSIETPVLVLAGAHEDDQPSRIAPLVAEALPNAEFISLPHMTHFGPFTHLTEIAALIRTA
jgi:pimeloyl-ACP methyl ester carboxylesterase